jgi:hypothetical protein
MAFLTVVCADKGSPGASTLGLLLAATHPGAGVLVEADPAGGDLAPRLFTASDHSHPVGANLLGLATDSRRGSDPHLVASHAAMTSVGARLVEGLASADQQIGLGPLWPSLTQAVLASETDVICDLGRTSALHPGLGMVTAAHRILFTVRPELEQLLRLRDRVQQLLVLTGGDATRIVVVVIAPEKTAQRDQRAVTQVLDSADLNKVRVEWFPFNPKELDAFYAGRLNGRSYLWRAATSLAAQLYATDTDTSTDTSVGAIPAATRTVADDDAAAARSGDPSWITS